jgi:hypothetical protein
MSADLAFALFGEPTLWNVQQRRLADDGLADGVAGRPPRSQQRSYTSAFEQGVMFRCANERQIAIAFGNACRCPACGRVYTDCIGGICQCTSEGSQLQLGAELYHGPGGLDDEGHFYDADGLRRLCRDGVQIQTTDGERLNEQILVQ